MYFPSEYLEDFTTYIDCLDKNQFYMKEQFTDFSRVEKSKVLEIKFDDLHVAMSKNGGLIAFCMKTGHYDIKKNSKLNRNIIVMFQDSFKRFITPIEWDNKKRYVVCLDFTAKQDLYAILNNGDVYQIKYNEQRAKQKLTSEIFKDVGIAKAKLFEKGFIAFTNVGQFYYVKDLKNIIPMLICYVPPFLNFDLNVDFMAIPAENTMSKRIEFLITKQDGNGGIIQIPLKEEGENVYFQPIDEKGNYLEIIGASLITRETPHQLIIANVSSNTNQKKDKKSKKKRRRNNRTPTKNRK